MAYKGSLKAIAVADLVGYSSQMKVDEAGTVAFVTRAFDRAERCSRKFRGQIATTTGDGWISLFDSVGDALDCATVMQRLIQRTEDTERAQFRMSVHLGEVRSEGNKIFGHAVNAAVRMEALADRSDG